MNGRQLGGLWVAGLACILFFGIGAPPWLRRGIEELITGAAARRQSAEAARRDSLAAKALVARIAPADSTRVIATPPAAASDTLDLPEDPETTALELKIARLLVLFGVPLALFWNTWRWWRGRGVTPGA